jgi:multidrug efflux pump subunit AcrA (membrane-fusion protein)
MRVTPRSPRVLLPIVIGLTLTTLTACGSEANSAIETAPVTKGEVAETVEAPAVVTARSVVTVSSPADGTIDEVRVADGDKVREGDVLLVIDSPDAERALSDAKQARNEARQAADVDLEAVDPSSAVSEADAAAQEAFDTAAEAIAAIPDAAARAQAEAALAAQRAAYEARRADVQDLIDQAGRSARSLETAVAQLASASTVQLDLAVDAAQRTVDALTVTASTSGVVTLGATASTGSTDLSGVTDQLPSNLQGLAGSLLGGGGSSSSTDGPVEPGLPVSSGQALATITDVSALGLSAQVDETDVLLVEPDDKATVQLDAVPDASYGATVSSVGVTPTTSSRGGVSYVVRLTLGGGEDADGEKAPTPRPGMSAVALLEVRSATNVVVVPASAIFRDGGRDQVWVDVDGKAERRTVRIGVEGADAVQVESGLTTKDVIVVRGADQVVEGQELT